MTDGEADGNAFLLSGAWTVRREERKDTDWIAKIRLFDGREIPTTVKNVSASGARLTVPEEMELPERFMFRVIGRDFVCAVRLMWRRGSHVGVCIERVGKIEAKPAAQGGAQGGAQDAPQAAPSPAAPPEPGPDFTPKRGSRISHA